MPPDPRHASPRSPSGQAAVELVALLPALAVCVLAAWQLALAGHAAWAVAGAARAAARAQAVGHDPTDAARRALPAPLRAQVRVRGSTDGVVEVRVRVPAVLAVLDLGTLTGRSRFAPQS